MVDTGTGDQAGPMGAQPGDMPTMAPSFDPLDNMPPVDIRPQMKRLSDATSVDEAIAALHGPDAVDVARAQVNQIQAERQRLEAMRDQAKAYRPSSS